jgi:poly(hydroxyalkanoate) depolymerase family esterase
MKLPFLNNMREAAQNLMGKGASAAMQQAMEQMRMHQAKGPAAPGPGSQQPAAAQPAMRDINPPPPHAAAAAAQSSVSAEAGTPPPQNSAASSGSAGAFGSPGSSSPNPATNPTEYAQDMLNRMGIQIDLQANINRAIDVGSVLHPARASAATLPEGAKFITGSHTNHAGTRKYKLYIPSTFRGQAMPLLVMLHGCTQDPDDFAAGTQMNQVAEEMACFVAYPEQTASNNHSKCWNWFNAIDQQRGQGEPSIIAGIAQQIIDEYPVNERQVYVAGLSAGGAMAVIVGTLYPELFAAVGVHSGLPFASAQDLPSALSAMKSGASTSRKAGDGSQPIIVFHGDSDTTVNPRNGEQVMEQRLHSHRGAPSVQSDSVPNGHRYTKTIHTKADGSPLGEHWVVHGAGHAWSGGSKSGTYTDAKGPDASREMLRFFRDVK